MLQNNVNSKRGTQLVVRVVLCMTTPYGPSLFAELFGGTVRLQKKRQKNRRPVFDWRTSCTKAEAMLRELLPYLREKKEQAEVALTIRALQTRKGRLYGENYDPETKQRIVDLGQKLHNLKHVKYVQ